MDGVTVGELRELFRHLLSWKSLYESEGVDELTSPEGNVYSLWDVEALYAEVVTLPPRQREAIELCLIRNIREKDAAVMMGVSPTNPVAMYATSGLEKLVALVESGEWQPNPRPDPGLTRQGQASCRFCTHTWTYTSPEEARRVAAFIKLHYEKQCQALQAMQKEQPA